MKYVAHVETARSRFEALLETLDPNAYECDVDQEDNGVAFTYELGEAGFLTLLIKEDGVELWAEADDEDCAVPMDPSPSLLDDAVWDADQVADLIAYASGVNEDEED